MTKLNIQLAPMIAAAAVIALTAGCSGGSSTDDAAQSTASSTTSTNATATAAPSSCRPIVPFSEGGRAAEGQAVLAQQVAESVELPAGVSIVTGRLGTDSDEPDMFGVTIDLCGGAISTADELRPLATQFAKAYKAAPAIGDQMFALRVAHYANYTETDASGELMLKDTDFQLHMWNGKPSVEAELNRWEVVHG